MWILSTVSLAGNQRSFWKTEKTFWSLPYKINETSKFLIVLAEAVFLVARATELFTKSLSKESFNFAAQQKKKTITKNHVDQALAMLPIEL